ncbi:WRKY domain-containing protein [Heracleum sosnowskyi]|uniref:WRKY domain-containing protein n=1 Tax=Heracleum sosnowskyi TaxID=360622 RepID=A0AAD8I1Q1_9APIA|nr:WRKY domain-containing protein [Heracleum sosnowskyi]
MEATWFEDELVRELLDDESPLFIVPYEESNLNTSSNSSNYTSNSSFLDQLISSCDVLSEQTVESASNSSSLTSNYPSSFMQELLSATSRSSLLERGMCKAESKYTLRIKSSGNVISDDGYKWRKYGQKSIKNSSNPRSYYRCTNPHCSAKKQVERSTDDPDTVIITYEGLHLHFTYPFLKMGQPDNTTPVAKKPKVSSPIVEAHPDDTHIAKPKEPGHISSGPLPMTGLAQEEVVLGPQGLLEDMVPFVIRNPQTNTGSSHSSSVSSCPSPPTSPLSFSWSPPHYSNLYFDIGI